MDDELVEGAIRANRAVAAEALLAIQVGADAIATGDALDLAAELSGLDPPLHWVNTLRAKHLLVAFVNAMRARGVRFDEEALSDPSGVIDDQALSVFLQKARAFRCRVRVNGSIAGSGSLVGPSLVLTSWHVVAVKPPGQPQEPAPNLSVVLSDGKTEAVGVPARFASECGDEEYENVLPKRDDDVAERHDVALLAMDRPAAAHLGFVPLPAEAPITRSRRRVVLVHFPEGTEQVIDFGRTKKVRNLTARWRHDVSTRAGSSGGACFDEELRLAGVHQGKLDDGGRFVPIGRFLAELADHVTLDVAPPRLWSLDGTVDGTLVMGRDLLFEAAATASTPGSRVRGVRVKRRVITDSAAGLAFTHDVLEALVARKGGRHLLVRVQIDEIVPDLVADVRERARAVGLAVPDPPEEAGVAAWTAPPETTAKDRAAILAAAVEAIAASRDLTVWFFFDNPSVPLTESARFAFEGFVDAALVQPHLRLAITGFETLPLPGLEFAGPFAAVGEGLPGLVVEFVGGFRRSDLLNMLTLASQDLTGEADPGRLAQAVDRALFGIADFNGLYADADLPLVVDRLRLDLGMLRDEGGDG